MHKKILKTVVAMAADAISVCLAMFLSYLITVKPLAFDLEFLFFVLGNVAATVFLFAILKLYSLIYSSVGLSDIVKIAAATIFIGAINIVIALLHKGSVWVGTAAVFTTLLFDFTVLIRLYKRIFFLGKYYVRGRDIKRKNVMLIGAGDAGATILREMQTSEKIAYNPVCILDDDENKIGMRIMGVKVAGKIEDVVKLANEYKAEEIFVTLPSVEKKRIAEILTIASKTKLPIKSIPGAYQLLNGKVSVSNLKKVEIQDLLGREQVEVNLNEIMGYIENKVVLVTGGGGSIGSELCRQIATHRPRQLIILDIYENNAYDIEQELKRKFAALNLTTLIASVRDEGKIRDVFEKYRPQIVFHAAAHKHVPLMETSPNEAIKNNVFGTLNVALNADRYKAETFVLISTDKAVNPTNVMGASKRICEMIIQTVGKNSANTNFVAVRFGNVLGSNGSVIPLFKKQIEAGGPVTVTDRNIIRYFMTIPEAVSLVLQAGAYAKKGQIFVLNMGEPVKIYDLAYNLIKLSGLEPNVDIDIVCTGLRPGEKLYEERLMAEEGLQTTPNGLINIAKPIPLDEEQFFKNLDKLYKLAYDENSDMRKAVKELVPTYIIPD